MSDDKIEVKTGASGKMRSPGAKPKPKAKAKVAKPAAKPAAAKMDSPKLSTLSSTSSKQTIYVDVDDEITAIIDKLTNASGKIVALVLPKRATVLQSIVNMKLLKRTAESAGKNLVLVTTEAGLLPLAGIVGLHVADTPSSRPAIPPMPDQPSDEPESVDEPLDIADNSGASEEEDFDSDAAAGTAIGVLAGTTAAAAALAKDADEEVVMEDDSASADGDGEKPNVVPVKKNKKLKVPNFDSFRLKLLLGALAFILLIVGWVFATKILPHATVTIQTNSEVITTNLNATLDTNAKEVDVASSIVPAVAQSTQKSYKESVPTTGQQNNGEKASGSVTFESSVCTLPAKKPSNIPAGSSVKSNGHTYITQEQATFGSPTLNGSGTCLIYSTNATDILALNPGTEYNLASGSSFTGAGTGTGSASGGTDDIIKVVSQTDIDTAKAKIAEQDASQQKQGLADALKGAGLMPVETTFVAGDQQVTTSADVGEQADTVTVTSVVPYTMLGIKQDDLKKLVVTNVESQIDKDKQVILDDGVAEAKFSQENPATATSAVVKVDVDSVAGPDLNEDELKKQVAGKKSADIKEAIKQLPGVTDVEVKYRPFWVSTAPDNVKKITIDIAKPSGSK